MHESLSIHGKYYACSSRAPSHRKTISLSISPCGQPRYGIFNVGRIMFKRNKICAGKIVEPSKTLCAYSSRTGSPEIISSRISLTDRSPVVYILYCLNKYNLVGVLCVKDIIKRLIELISISKRHPSGNAVSEEDPISKAGCIIL